MSDSLWPRESQHARPPSITNSWSSLKLTSFESVMPSSHLILCCPLFLLPPIPPSIRVFSTESTLRMRWPKYILAYKIFCYFDKMNECYFTVIYGDYGIHGQRSFYFYKINPSSGNLKWVNNGYKPNSQGYGKSKMAAWLFKAPWKTSLLFDKIKAFLAIGLISHNEKIG